MQPSSLPRLQYLFEISSMKYLCPLALALTISLSSCGGGGSGSSCNVAEGAFCAAGEYCAYLDNSCGGPGASGSCMALPAGCQPDSAPVCTCDSLTFTNECFASQAGQSIKNAGECA